jgi:predicted ATP-grasp superfamily ATP-dependent carboligase
MGRCRVLCGVDEATGSLAGVRGLSAAGYEPWLALSHRHTYVALTRYSAGAAWLPDPLNEPETYALRLAAEARRIGARVVLPFTEATLRALSGRDDLFERAVLGVCPPEIVERATDKGLLVDLCRRAGLDRLPTVEVNAETVEQVDVSFPAVIKPQRSVTSDGKTLRRNHVVEVGKQAELRRYVLARPGATFLVQPRLEGTLAAICGVAWKGRLVCASHQVSPRIWPTTYGISAFARTVPPNEEREARVARLLELIGWSGIFGLQFIINGTTAYAIDLNPRIYGSAALAIAAGHNLPAIWTDLLLGQRPVIKPYRVGMYYREETNDVRALAVEFSNGNRGAAIRGLLPHRNTVHAVFSLRDPLPASEIARKGLVSAVRVLSSLSRLRRGKGSRDHTHRGDATPPMHTVRVSAMHRMRFLYRVRQQVAHRRGSKR